MEDMTKMRKQIKLKHIQNSASVVNNTIKSTAVSVSITNAAKTFVCGYNSDVMDILKGNLATVESETENQRIQRYLQSLNGSTTTAMLVINELEQAIKLAIMTELKASESITDDLIDALSLDTKTLKTLTDFIADYFTALKSVLNPADEESVDADEESVDANEFAANMVRHMLWVMYHVITNSCEHDML